MSSCIEPCTLNLSMRPQNTLPCVRRAMPMQEQNLMVQCARFNTTGHSLFHVTLLPAVKEKVPYYNTFTET
jgi:hypothetical protein